MNKANFDSNKRGNKGESHRTHPSRMEMFRWLLRNGINKTELMGLEQRFNTALPKVGWARWTLVGLPTLEGPKQVCSISCLEIEGDYNEESDQQSLEAVVRQIKQDKDGPKGQGPLAQLAGDTKPSATIVGKMVRGWRSFWDSLI